MGTKQEMKLPRYTKYKPIGVEWLGDLPDHWKIPPLYTRYRIDLGKMLNERRIIGEHLVPYLRNIDVQWGRIDVLGLPEMDIAPSETTR
jgi:type I restriction enzyme, S subunit